MAKGVQEAGGANCALKPVAEVINDDLIAADGIIAGSPVYYEAMAAAMKSLFDQSVIVRMKWRTRLAWRLSPRRTLRG